jgi:hypothetical protein
MKPIHNIVLVDDNAGADVTPAILAQIAAAVQEQIHAHYAPHWGHPMVTVTAGAAPAEGSEAVPVYVRASSDVEGAAGYHDDDGIYVFRDGLPALTSGAFSLSVVVSHEVLEALGDPGANRWADNGQGEEYALELCDAVEGYCYDLTVGGVTTSVSDFLLPSFFDAGGVAPYSYLGKPTAPLLTAPDNGADYQIARSVDESGAQQVTAIGTVHAARLPAKKHPRSRTSRRGVVL